MTVRRIGAAALAVAGPLMLAACETQMDGLDKQPEITETFLRITADGAGPLTGATAYDAKTIEGLMPGYTTGSVLIGLETGTTNATVLFRKIYEGQIQVLHILSAPNGRIGQIHGVTHHVIGPAGERPGMTFREAGVDPASCRPGTNLWLGMAICTSRGAPNVVLTFSFKGEAATSVKLPARAVLDTGELQRIIWTAPAG
ncbi:DUF1131 family protein [Prosthecomicrobium hirschii]|nr:DUF1131 family protein [Prosthecomicrobium hirschii]MCW1843544.1 DUF1131 family protein [Prosthecomicrobium hirschii]